MRVLVVDDDEAIRLVVRYALDGDVLEAVDGLTALEILETEPVDLVVLDVMLPQMSGFEVLERIRHDHATSEVPVVMLTCQRTEHSHHTAFAGGADAYVTKPFDPIVFEDEVMRVLALTPEARRAARAEQQHLSSLLDQIEASFGG